MNFSWEALIGIVVGVSSIISASALGIRWLVKHYFDEIKHEIKPNGGASMKDQVTRLERDVIDLKKQNENGELYHQRIDNKIDDLTKMFVDYISHQRSKN